LSLLLNRTQAKQSNSSPSNSFHLRMSGRKIYRNALPAAAAKLVRTRSPSCESDADAQTSPGSLRARETGASTSHGPELTEPFDYDGRTLCPPRFAKFVRRPHFGHSRPDPAMGPGANAVEMRFLPIPTRIFRQ